MNEFKKRQRLKKIIYSRATVALLIIIVLFMTHAVWDIFWKYRGSIAAENQLKSQLSNVEAERVYLASSTEALQSQSGIQYELKEKFGAVASGEKEIVIVNTATTTSSAAPENQNFFQHIFSWFSNL